MPGGTPLLFTDIAGRGSRIWIATNAMASSIMNAVAPIILTTDGGKSWSYSQSTKTMAIRAISFPEDQRGWAAAFGGILVTTDGGRTWTQVTDTGGQIVVDVCSLDGAHGWAVTYQGDVYRLRPL